MSQPFDMRDLLREWEFNPDDAVRLVQGADGREIMQVRTPLGIEQYELEGRPDGLRPHNTTTALDYYRAKLRRYQTQGKTDSFRLTAGECAELFEEGVLFYFRYLHLFTIKQWSRVARDTTRNLSLFDFVRDHAKRQQDRIHLEQWRPYILRMHTISRAMVEWEAGHHRQALRLANEGLTAIEDLPDLDHETFQFERQRSLEALRDLANQIQKSLPLSEIETLERDLKAAIESEQFERAASLRDRIRALRAQEV